jgi:hypothetical protein
MNNCPKVADRSAVVALRSSERAAIFAERDPNTNCLIDP